MRKRFLNGFTIVELIIAVTAISILALVSVVSYNGLQGRGQEAAVQTDLTKIADNFNVFYSDNGRYPNSATEMTARASPATRGVYFASGSPLQYCFDSDYKSMTVVARAKTGAYFSISNDGTVGSTLGFTNVCGGRTTILIYTTPNTWVSGF